MPAKKTMEKKVPQSGPYIVQFQFRVTFIKRWFTAITEGSTDTAQNSVVCLLSMHHPCRLLKRDGRGKVSVVAQWDEDTKRIPEAGECAEVPDWVMQASAEAEIARQLRHEADRRNPSRRKH